MSKHFGELETIDEKIIHILYAGFLNDYYEQSIKECKHIFGVQATKRIQALFEKDYMEGITVLS